MYKFHFHGGSKKRFMNLTRGLFAVVFSTAVFSAAAQTPIFPASPIRLVVAFPPGGPNDVLARAFAPKLSEILGVSVFVENKGGASGVIGTAFTVNSKPDGYTITLASTGILSIGLHTKLNLPYRLSDLTAVAMVAASASVIAINPTLPAKNLQELVALSKSRQISIASAGNGSISHLNIGLIQEVMGGDFLHVPYTGAVPAITGVISGQVDGTIMAYAALSNMISQGRIRAIGSSQNIGSIEVSPAIVSPWYAVMAPAKTPRSTIKTLHAAFAKVLSDPEIIARIERLGIDPFVLPTPEEADAYIRADSSRWAAIVKTSGLKVE